MCDLATHLRGHLNVAHDKKEWKKEFLKLYGFEWDNNVYNNHASGTKSFCEVSHHWMCSKCSEENLFPRKREFDQHVKSMHENPCELVQPGSPLVDLCFGTRLKVKCMLHTYPLEELSPTSCHLQFGLNEPVLARRIDQPNNPTVLIYEVDAPDPEVLDYPSCDISVYVRFDGHSKRFVERIGGQQPLPAAEIGDSTPPNSVVADALGMNMMISRVSLPAESESIQAAFLPKLQRLAGVKKEDEEKPTHEEIEPTSAAGVSVMQADMKKRLGSSETSSLTNAFDASRTPGSSRILRQSSTVDTDGPSQALPPPYVESVTVDATTLHVDMGRLSLRGSSSSRAAPANVWIHGSCSGNGGAGALAGVGVWWGEEDPRNVSEPLVTTAAESANNKNNRAALQAIYRAMEMAGTRVSELRVHTNNSYAINCLDKWIQEWKANGWHTKDKSPVKNRDLLEKLWNLKNEPGMPKVVFVKIGRHNQAQQLAQDGAKWGVAA
ncbi:hypothetical protein HDU93_002302 [Gonapodya sp. JEL0774]|nr:hypothetical protein HDU93_002302 [Gonapodya sp. JEL0774]